MTALEDMNSSASDADKGINIIVKREANEDVAEFDLTFTLYNLNDVICLDIQYANDIFYFETMKILMNRSVSVFFVIVY